MDAVLAIVAVTVTLAVKSKSPSELVRQATVVDDVHDDVKHGPRSPASPW